MGLRDVPSGARKLVRSLAGQKAVIVGFRRTDTNDLYVIRPQSESKSGQELLTQLSLELSCFRDAPIQDGTGMVDVSWDFDFLRNHSSDEPAYQDVFKVIAELEGENQNQLADPDDGPDND